MSDTFNIAMQTNPNGGAIFSEDRRFRYALWRRWDKSLPSVMFIGLNPSKADETEPDNTIKSVIRIAKHNGYGGIYMMNCFAFVSTDPDGLLMDPFAAIENNSLLEVTSVLCQDVVFAWGGFKVVRETKRDEEIFRMFPDAKALHINKDGSPKHPLYCKTETKLVDYKSVYLDFEIPWTKMNPEMTIMDEMWNDKKGM